MFISKGDQIDYPMGQTWFDNNSLLQNSLKVRGAVAEEQMAPKIQSTDHPWTRGALTPSTEVGGKSRRQLTRTVRGAGGAWQIHP